MPKIFTIASKWRNFAKIGHTARERERERERERKRWEGDKPMNRMRTGQNNKSSNARLKEICLAMSSQSNLVDSLSKILKRDFKVILASYEH